jgi:Zn-dependent protease with chaperone function
MHAWMIAFSLCLGIGTRFFLLRSCEHQTQKSQFHPHEVQYGLHILSAFLIPPILFLVTAIAMLPMGTTGLMLGIPVGKIGFIVGIGFLTIAGSLALYLGIQSWRSLQKVRTYPSITINKYLIRVLDIATPFAGQIGFWNPELVVSQGLLDTLTEEQIIAVLTHEDAHNHYHDTFWFFWLGWLRTLTCWLPQTQLLWQELLMLREIRADRWATHVQSIDSLLLAESLLKVVRLASQPIQGNCAAFNLLSSSSRLTIRMDALLTPCDPKTPRTFNFYWQFLIVSWPLLAIALHH